MSRPNFFIVGAPKCGTTSLAAWLAEHPDVFIPAMKEVHYFNTDEERVVTTPEAYEALYDRARPDQIARGDASVWYLYSRTAIPNIARYAPQARHIVMLRNPIAMAPSLHEQLVFSGVETVTDFAEAWALQGTRREGRDLPRGCLHPRRLQYGEACRLGAQLQRMLATIPHEQVLVLLIDDLTRDPATAYARVLAHLGVAHDGRTEFPAHNQAKQRVVPGVAALGQIAYRAKRALGIQRGFGILNRVDVLTSTSRKRTPLPADVSAALHAYFADDVRLLADIIGRDLSHWLDIPDAGQTRGI